MGLTSAFGSVVRRKLIIWPLIGTMGVQLYASGGNAFETVLMVGDPKQAEIQILENSDKLPIDFSEEKDKESVKKICNVYQKETIKDTCNFTFAPDYKDTKVEVNEEFLNLTKQGYEFRKLVLHNARHSLMKKTGVKVPEDGFAEHFKKSGKGKILLRGTIKGYTDFFGELEPNERLAGIRAKKYRESAKNIIYNMVVQELGVKEYDVNIDVKSGGMITDHKIVEQAVGILNEYSPQTGIVLDYSKIRKKNEQEIRLLNRALRIAREEGFRYKGHYLYDYLKEMAEPLRKIDAHLIVTFNGHIEGVLIFVKQKKVEKAILPPVAAFERNWRIIEDTNRHKFSKINIHLDNKAIQAKARKRFKKNIPRSARDDVRGNRYTKL